MKVLPAKVKLRQLGGGLLIVQQIPRIAGCLWLWPPQALVRSLATCFLRSYDVSGTSLAPTIQNQPSTSTCRPRSGPTGGRAENPRWCPSAVWAGRHGWASGHVVLRPAQEHKAPSEGPGNKNGFWRMNRSSRGRKWPVKWGEGSQGGGAGTALAVQGLRLHFPMERVQVWPLVGELRSHMTCGQKKPKHKTEKIL